MGGRVHPQLLDGIIGPTLEVTGKQFVWQSQKPANQSSPGFVSLMLDLDPHKGGIIGIVLNGFGEIDDLHDS